MRNTLRGGSFFSVLWISGVSSPSAGSGIGGVVFPFFVLDLFVLDLFVLDLAPTAARRGS